jgi:hypothetical protein
MSAAVSADIARNYLRTIDPPWQRFWFHMHSVAKDLDEFAEGIGGMSDAVFEYHVSGQKNDLARWVREVVGDSMLAEELEKIRTREDAKALVAARVAELHRATG